MKKALGQNGLNFIAGKYKELRTALSNKVDKVNGKGLSTNDYDSTAKSKVDAIPVNPKYTDTTYDLSKYAEKSNISRCKTKGYNTSSTWQDLSTERDLEDWIGDFDKRTRELKNGVGVEEFAVEPYVPHGFGKVSAYKIGRLVILVASGNGDLQSSGALFYTNLPDHYRPRSTASSHCADCWVYVGDDGTCWVVPDREGRPVYGFVAYQARA